jgi:hypothetical protein
MFCPNCGKDNIPECKFCASCGTNLDVVTRALYRDSAGLYRRFDGALHQFIASYAERVFKRAPSADSRSLSDSWKVLGQGLLTSGVDFILFWLMLFAVFPLRLLLLLLSTPVRLLTDMSNRPTALAPREARKRMSGVRGRDDGDKVDVGQWPAGRVASVVEHTTEHLQDYHPPSRGRDEAMKEQRK